MFLQAAENRWPYLARPIGRLATTTSLPIVRAESLVCFNRRERFFAPIASAYLPSSAPILHYVVAGRADPFAVSRSLTHRDITRSWIDDAIEDRSTFLAAVPSDLPRSYAGTLSLHSSTDRRRTEYRFYFASLTHNTDRYSRYDSLSSGCDPRVSSRAVRSNKIQARRLIVRQAKRRWPCSSSHVFPITPLVFLDRVRFAFDSRYISLRRARSPNPAITSRAVSPPGRRDSIPRPQ